MKQITFIRHGKVDIENIQRIKSSFLPQWVDTYNSAPLHPESLPSHITIKYAAEAEMIITSRLRRAIDSAKILGVRINEKNALFNEASVPHVDIPFLKLKPKSWLLLLRLLLLAGVGKKDTSLKASKSQAKKAAERLSELSLKYDHIVLIGHGGMNWLICKVLLKEGWIPEGKGSHENWGVTVLKLPTSASSSCS